MILNKLNREMIPTLLFLTMLISLITIQLNFFSEFKYLPSEHYGGDQYFHMGRSLHFFQGKPFYEGSDYVTEYEHYPWLTNAIIAIIAWALHISVLKATIFFPIFSTVLTAIITYLIGRKITKNGYFAVLFSAIASTYYMTDSHPSEFAKFTFIPLITFAVYFLYFETGKTEKNRLWKIISVGVVLGFAALQHVVSFLFGIILFMVAVLIKIILTKQIHTELKNFAITMFIALPISLLYWWPILFIYKAKTLNSWQEWVTPSVYPSLRNVLGSLKGLFVNTSNLLETIISGIIIIGLVVVFIALIQNIINMRKESKNSHVCMSILQVLKETKLLLPLLLVLSFFVGYLHPYITKPLFNISLGYYRFMLMLPLARYLLFSIILLFIIDNIAKKVSVRIPSVSEKFSLPLPLPRILFKMTVTGIFIGLILLTYIQTLSSPQYDRALYFAKTENSLIEAYLQFYNFSQIEAPEIYTKSPVISIDPNQLFLLNGLTGSKVFVTARTHANPFVDQDQREAELAVMLYGKDEEERQHLLKKGNIKYFFMEKNGLKQLAGCKYFYFKELPSQELKKETFPEEEAKVFCMKTSVAYEAYLRENGVSFKRDFVRISPDKNAPQRELLLIKPEKVVLRYTPLFEIYEQQTTEQQKYPLFLFARINDDAQST